jgi:predicted nuclease of predicted toxin-antitoxin system
MRFLLDEGTDARIAPFLQQEGHDVAVVGRDRLYAMKDEDVLATAFAEARILITDDRGFGQLIFQRRLQHAGVILFRPGHLALPIRIAALTTLLNDHPNQMSNFIVITERGFRVGYG